MSDLWTFDPARYVTMDGVYAKDEIEHTLRKELGDVVYEDAPILFKEGDEITYAGGDATVRGLGYRVAYDMQTGKHVARSYYILATSDTNIHAIHIKDTTLKLR